MTLFTLIILASAILVLFPLVSPNQMLYIVCGSTYTLLTSPVNYAPLVADYVMKDSIGKATAFSLMGLSIGVIFSLGVLFQFTKDLDP